MPQTQPKRHAFDYLKDLFEDEKTPAWLAGLIAEAVASGFNIGDESFSRLVEDFMADKFMRGSPARVFPTTTPATASNQPTTLLKLTHKSGVNALKHNSGLKFGKEVTVVFGRNGSGKSGYFRILNGARTGGDQTQILSNVYSNTTVPPPIDVVFECQQGAQGATPIAWDGTAPVRAFSGMLVFNHEYAQQLIQKRGISSAALAPLGLHVFADLTKAVDVFKERLGKRLEELKQQYPTVQDQILTSDFLSRIQNGELPLAHFQNELKTISFAEAEINALERKKKELASLSNTDPTDTLRLKQNTRADLILLLAHITDTVSALQDTRKEWNDALDAYQKAFQNAEQARIQYRALTSIPGSDTQIWKTFIQSAATYSQQQNGQEVDVCPYCRQPIRDESTVELLKCYGAFLKDESQIAFETAQNNLKRIQLRINSLRREYPLSESLKQELSHHATGDKSCLEEYDDWLRQINSMEEKLAVSLKENHCIEDVVPDCRQVLESLRNCDRKLLKEVDDLQTDDKERKKRMVVLEGEIKDFEHRQRMDCHRSEIQKWIDYHQFVLGMERNIERISSSRVSSMAKRAHNELLTENLRKKFAARYEQFKLGWTKVVLEVAGASKGETKTELVLETSRSYAMGDILSEGEQKAVALAMFLTEADMNPALGPLVFDDPVTSLDNGVIEVFVRMLVALERQVIVFTHNQYFLDCIQRQKDAHLCKNLHNGCSKDGRHVWLWNIQRFHGETGIASPGQGERAADVLASVKHALAGDVSRIDLAGLLLKLRQAIEKLIDEKVLRNIVPCRLNAGNNVINWGELKQLNNDESFQRQVDQLKEIHSRISNGGVHTGTTVRENPVDLEEVAKFCEDLSRMESNGTCPI